MNVQVSLAAAMLLVAALVGLGWLARKADTPYRCEYGRLVEVER